MTLGTNCPHLHLPGPVSLTEHGVEMTSLVKVHNVNYPATIYPHEACYTVLCIVDHEEGLLIVTCFGCETVLYNYSHLILL